MTRPPSGTGLVELIVALTLLAVGVLGLAAAGTFAQRSFATAEAVERSARAAAAVLDSLMHEPAPAAGDRLVDAVRVHWTVEPLDATTGISLVTAVHDGAGLHVFEWEAVHDGRLLR